ncbi:helix-turn-helix domain-containing protein [Streptomyces sp. NPDC091377]|uniref:helix-turn-helix domain-containing protein n=1 Tax=Streptomyces sp. NPDC091377 TaxID=3365995 RepID=UPI0037F63278
MLVTEFSTESVAAPERFELFTEFTSRSHTVNRLRSNNQDDFRSSIRTLALGELQISNMRLPHLEITRTAKLVRQSDPEVYQFNYFLGQAARLSVDGTCTALGAGDLVMLDSSRPYRADVPGAGEHITVQLPRRLMPLPEKTMRRLLAVPISARSGMGCMLGEWLTTVQARASDFTRADVCALTSVSLDLLASVAARWLGTENALTPEARRNALRARINTFAEQHLADPAMTPQMIADAHHISLRHLQQLLAEDGTSPAAWIRHRRLERCRLDLADPRLSSQPIQAIAARWGFTNPMHFSRLFRTAYGIPPRDYRNLPPEACANRQTSRAE